jgi:ornithine cyclodeaminase/alanine dehydrogenase-like protein (mu-crystallin family)
VSLTTAFPENEAKGRLTIHALIVLFSNDGIPLALLDRVIAAKMRAL